MNSTHVFAKVEPSTLVRGQFVFPPNLTMPCSSHLHSDVFVVFDFTKKV